MAIGVVFPVADAAPPSWTATHVGAAAWGDEFRAEDPLVSNDVNEQDISLGEAKGIGVLHEGMLGDYYYRVYFIPSFTLTVRNPTTDVPIPYFIWNAFFDPNEITARAETGDTGIINSADVGETFKRLELREFTITFTEDAPLTVDAEYDYEFTLGEAIFNVIALRIGVFADRPEMPARRQLSYFTDVLQAWDGTEQRISVRDEPRLTLNYTYFLPTEPDIRRFRELLFRGLGSEYAMPLWGDATNLATAALPGATELDVDLSLADLYEDEFILVETPVGEQYLFRVAEIDGNEVTVDTVVGAEIPAGSAVFPMIRVQVQEGAGISSYPINAGTASITGISMETRLLGGAGGVLTTYKGTPVLEQIPLNNDQVEEDFQRKLETFDYGGQIEVYSAQLVSRVSGNRTFWIETRQERQDMKVFLDAVAGMRNPFFAPTFRDDLIPAGDTGNERFIDVQSGTMVGDNYLTTYFDAVGFRALRIKTPTQIYYATVIAVSQINADTVRLELEEDFEGEQDQISQISIMRLSRLASDNVGVKDFNLDSEITLSITTTEQ